VVDADTRALLDGRTVVFLDVSVAEASNRVGMSGPRPLLLGNVRGRLRQLMDERRPLYTQVATLTVDTSGRTPDDIVSEILPAVPRWA
jgi:shikimate kinase